MKKDIINAAADGDREPDQLYAPNGKLITAAKDWLPAHALIQGATRAADGQLKIEWLGETEIDWNGRYTERSGDQRVFLDQDHIEWTEDQISLGSEAPKLAPRTDPGLGSPQHAHDYLIEAIEEMDVRFRRATLARRALSAAYRYADDPAKAVTDLLGDLRHLCDALGFDWAKLDRQAYLDYAAVRVREAHRKTKGAK